MTSLVRQLTVSALVLLSGRRLVLIFHSKLGVHLYPGGHVEPQETPDEAVLREVAEETGLRVALIGPLHRELEDPAAAVFALTTPYLAMCERINDPVQPHDHIDLIYPCVVHDEDAASLGHLIIVRHEDVARLPTFPSFRRLLDKVFTDDALWKQAERTRQNLQNNRVPADELT